MYKVTQKVVDLVEELIGSGYTGSVQFTNSYPTGAAEILSGSYSLELSGFCKETLYVTEDMETGKLVFIGRYSQEHIYPTVDGIVELAWSKYEHYKDRGYSRPCEFEDLFKNFGYLIQREIPAKTILEEK